MYALRSCSEVDQISKETQNCIYDLQNRTNKIYDWW